ncbi:acetyl-CoA acetyltransferase [Amycolatopsis sp. K13G38]|uniref:Acetyl-CoA acetyltransferase n=1 Tax=Amycolatopsis acididurans TaxID=2724524 RepID=A0ABX1JBA0_9PSEU|nr:acetyl-CoA acetyltransferase [Amycolatopsis acididurans]NKQ56764.1 acetyl-CoA acetyltransferase [Amycolatopsis acididurans]
MSLDPRTPVLVGGGQLNRRDGEPEREPVALIAEAARAAELDSGGRGLLRALDSIRLVRMLSWRYRDPGRLVAAELGASPRHTAYTGDGGNSPQALVSGAAADIAEGRADVVLIGGAEAWRTRMRLRAEGKRPDWTVQDESVTKAPVLGAAEPLLGDGELRIGLDRPSSVYPLFEQSLRIAAGRGIDQHLKHCGELWSRFSEVAARNPHAWTTRACSAEEITTPSPANRWISWPYPKLMNSNNMVEQGAAVLLCSVAAAVRAGVPRENWVFPWSSAEAHDTYAIAERQALHGSPAIRIAGQRALSLAGAGAGDLGPVDIYSCFPAAVQVAAAELGLPVDDPARPLTITGGLTFAGGPWNNYVTHSIATMITALRECGGKGLITANGGYLTKHALGVYGTEPPPEGFRSENVQSEVDREPTTPALDSWQGTGSLESWTVVHDRGGAPETAFLAVRTPEGARTLAVNREPETLATLVSDEMAGAPVAVGEDGTGWPEGVR